MKTSLFSLTAAALLLGACNKGTTPKGQVVLTTSQDSLSYAIGTQIGGNMRGNFHRSELDSLNFELVSTGFRDALDSTGTIPQAKLDEVVKAVMTKKREAKVAEENAKAEENLQKGQAWLAENAKKPGVTTTASGLQYEVLTMGKGPKPTIDDEVETNYRGTLIDGHEFESTYKHGQTAKFPLKGVIPGWTEALQLMPVGSKWRVYIPAGLGWGAQAQGEDIPANSVVIFDLELVSILPKEAAKKK